VTELPNPPFNTGCPCEDPITGFPNGNTDQGFGCCWDGTPATAPQDQGGCVFPTPSPPEPEDCTTEGCPPDEACDTASGLCYMIFVTPSAYIPTCVELGCTGNTYCDADGTCHYMTPSPPPMPTCLNGGIICTSNTYCDADGTCHYMTPSPPPMPTCLNGGITCTGNTYCDADGTCHYVTPSPY